MHNNLFSVGPLTVRGYGLMLAIGVFCGVMLTVKLSKKRGLDDDLAFNAALIGVFCGILSAKLFYIITELPTYIKHPEYLLDVANGFMLYGGVIGGVGSGLLYLKIKKQPVLEYVDCAVPNLALAQGFGRLGCFLAGCCYGVPTDSFIGITFPPESVSPSGIPLVPTQLISSGFDFLLAASLYWILSKKPKTGYVSALYGALYAIGRFFIEFYRNDPRGNVGALSTSQFIAVIILPVTCFFFYRISKNAKNANADGAGTIE